jgi:hypothetical protein
VKNKTYKTKKIYKITKYFQGGVTTYYALMSKAMKMKLGCWEYQLCEWGDGTAGGRNYGYKIKVKDVRSMAGGSKVLEFNERYLEKGKKK